MGHYQNNPEKTEKKKNRRGSVKNNMRLAAFASAAGGGSADWGSCAPERLQAVVIKITALGGAVTFGMSRDQGAYSLTLLLDNERETLWFNGGVDLDAELDKVAATLDAMS